jgi:hypothetical protein
MNKLKVNVVAVVLFLFFCSYYLNDDTGLQSVRFYLTILNNSSDTLKITQYPHFTDTDYPTTKRIYDTTFIVPPLQQYLDSIGYEFVASKPRSSKTFSLSTAPGDIRITAFDLNISRPDSMIQMIILPWDTTMGDWVGIWDELGKMYDTLVIN